MKTVSSLARGQSTMNQSKIFERADRMFANKFGPQRRAGDNALGRQYGGILSEAEVFELTVNLKLGE